MTSGNFHVAYVTTASTHGKVDFYSLNVTSNANFSSISSANHSSNDKNKKFYLATDSLTIATSTFYCGSSQWTFQGKTSGFFEVPSNGNLGFYGNNGTFNCDLRSIVIDSTANGVGSKARICKGAELNLDYLKIESGALLSSTEGGKIYCSSALQFVYHSSQYYL